MPNIEAGIAALAALDPTPTVTDAPADGTPTDAAAEAPAAAASGEQVADSDAQVVEEQQTPPPAPNPAEIEAQTRQARLDEQLRAMRERRRAEREEKARERAAKRESAQSGQQEAERLAALDKDPIQYMLDKGLDPAKQLQKLADAAKKSGTPEAQIEAMKAQWKADLDARDAKIAQLEQRDTEREKAAAKQQEESQKRAAIVASENEFVATFLKVDRPYARAFCENREELLQTAYAVQKSLTGRLGRAVSREEIANEMELNAKALADRALKVASPQQGAAGNGGNGAAKSDSKSVGAPKVNGAKTLSNELSSTRASNGMSKRMGLEERQREAAKMLRAMDSQTK